MKIRTRALKITVLYTLALICAKKYAKEHYVDLKTAMKYISNGIEYKIVTSKNWLKLINNNIDGRKINYIIRDIKCYKKLSHKWTREIDCNCVANMIYKEFGVTPEEIMTFHEIEKMIRRVESNE